MEKLLSESLHKLGFKLYIDIFLFYFIKNSLYILSIFLHVMFCQ